MYYGELRLTGLDRDRLAEALLECQIQLVKMGLISNVEVVVEKKNKQGDFLPVKSIRQFQLILKANTGFHGSTADNAGEFDGWNAAVNALNGD
jgi:hypothetical protein